MKKIIYTLFGLLLLIFLVGLNIAEAGVVPGTIKAWPYRMELDCKNEAHEYSPTNYTCEITTECLEPVESNCLCGNAIPASGCDENGENCTQEAVADTNNCECSCEEYKTNAHIYGRNIFYDRIANSKSSKPLNPIDTQLTDDNDNACLHAILLTGSKYHNKPISKDTICTGENKKYWAGGESAICDITDSKSKDYVFTLYKQDGTKVAGLVRDFDFGNNTCTVRTRSSTPDNDKPTVTTNWELFTADGEWCDYGRYTDSQVLYGQDTDGNDEPGNRTKGCDVYKMKSEDKENEDGTDKHNPDLGAGLEITVQDPLSGLRSLTLELGSCSYKLPIKEPTLDELLVGSPDSQDTTTIKPKYTQEFKFLYDTGSVLSHEIDGLIKLPSLLEAFNVDRIDECYTNGENYLRVIAVDNAACETDGATLGSCSNKKNQKESGTINIDNSTPKVLLSGNPFSKTEGVTLLSGNISPKWKNITMNGNIYTGDPYDSGDAGKCTITYGTGNCNDDFPAGKPSGAEWIQPYLVDPITGEYPKTMCDGLNISGACEYKVRQYDWEIGPWSRSYDAPSCGDVSEYAYVKCMDTTVSPFEEVKISNCISDKGDYNQYNIVKKEDWYIKVSKTVHQDICQKNHIIVCDKWDSNDINKCIDVQISEEDNTYKLKTTTYGYLRNQLEKICKERGVIQLSESDNDLAGKTYLKNLKTTYKKLGNTSRIYNESNAGDGVKISWGNSNTDIIDTYDCDSTNN